MLRELFLPPPFGSSGHDTPTPALYPLWELDIQYKSALPVV